jgi:hypothetical protein
MFLKVVLFWWQSREGQTLKSPLVSLDLISFLRCLFYPELDSSTIV